MRPCIAHRLLKNTVLKSLLYRLSPEWQTCKRATPRTFILGVRDRSITAIILNPLTEVNLEPGSPKPNKITVYLASASPRRRELLQQAGIRYQVILPDIDEVVQLGESAEVFVIRVAREKAQAGQALVIKEGRPAAPVLGADTCIVLENEIIGKPGSRAEGIRMLTRLAGRSHEVLTGVALVEEGNIQQALSCSRVVFGPLSAKEIEDYWESGEPADKAGAYAIQGKAGAFIERIEGSYTGIVGLPLNEIVSMIKKTGAGL